MIQDLDGATTEPSRRRHVTVLSASVAAVSLVLLYVLVAPATHVGAPQAASPSPTPSSVLTVVSNPLITMPLPLINMPLEMRSGLCADRTTWGQFLLAVDAASGPAFPLVVYDRTGSRPVAFVQEERGTGRLIVTCAAPDSLAPRINRAR